MNKPQLNHQQVEPWYIYPKTFHINSEQTFKYTVQKNWNLFSLKSWFLINDAINEHPSMKHRKFNNKYMEELLRIITHENKNCILTGEFNLNLLKHSRSPGVSKFLEIPLSYNFMPQITLSTRIAEKMATLIDDILIKNNVLNYISGSITLSI